ncbi:MAG TPA: FixH family protein, partial [Blastocatellia bacterium]|nr:FixH family protein [Blastocatellia bacterium]
MSVDIIQNSIQQSEAMNNDSEGKKSSRWGWGIAAVYTAFALGTIGMVVLTRQHRVELVSKDYYAKEVAYEKQINRERETQVIDDHVNCAVTEDGKFIKLKLPVMQGAVRGTLMLYRPSNSDL